MNEEYIEIVEIDEKRGIINFVYRPPNYPGCIAWDAKVGPDHWTNVAKVPVSKND